MVSHQAPVTNIEAELSPTLQPRFAVARTSAAWRRAAAPLISKQGLYLGRPKRTCGSLTLHRDHLRLVVSSLLPH